MLLGEMKKSKNGEVSYYATIAVKKSNESIRISAINNSVILKFMPGLRKAYLIKKYDFDEKNKNMVGDEKVKIISLILIISLIFKLI